MSVIQYPSTTYIKTIDTSELVSLGTVTLARNTELDSIHPLIYIKGNLAGTEQVRINVYSDAGVSLLYQSAWSALSGLSPAPNGNWLGWVQCTFARQNLCSADVYYIELELTGYTRNADTFYISSVYDWPAPTNVNANAPHYSRAFRVFGYEVLDYTQ